MSTKEMGISEPKSCIQETSIIVIIVKILMMTFRDTNYLAGTEDRHLSNTFS